MSITGRPLGKLVVLRPQLSEADEEGRDLEIAGLHRTIDILREYIELAMQYDGAGQRLALRSALLVANRAVPR